MVDLTNPEMVRAAFDFAKAEVHDGDIIILHIKDQSLPATKIAAFRRQLSEHVEEAGWTERGILFLVVNTPIEILKVDGPVRLEPKRPFDVDRVVGGAVNRLQQVSSQGSSGLLGHDAWGNSLTREIVEAIVAAIGEELG